MSFCAKHRAKIDTPTAMETAKHVGVSQSIDLSRGRTFWLAVLNFNDISSRDKVSHTFYRFNYSFLIGTR